MQGRRKDLKVVGPDIKSEWHSTICFTLFSPKSGWAQANTAHTLPTALMFRPAMSTAKYVVHSSC